LEPPGHPAHRDERRRCEHEWGKDRESGSLRGLGIADGKTDGCEDPRQRVPEQNDDPTAGEEREPAAVETEADAVPDDRHEDHYEHVASRVRERAPCEKRRTSHRQRPEPLEQTTLHIRRKPDRRSHRAEYDYLREDPWDQVVNVRDGTRNADGTAEHVAEHQNEDHRLDSGEHEVLLD